MTTDVDKKDKACCTREYERLIEQLEMCDRRHKNSGDHHRCYRIAARRSGRQSKRCMYGV